MRNQFIVQAIAASVSVLILSSGCSSNSPTVSEKISSREQLHIPNPQPQIEQEAMMADSAADHASSPVARLSSNMTQSATARVVEPMRKLDERTPIVRNTEKYQNLDSNPVIQVSDESTSTFSIDVDTGAYANVRRFINTGQLPPADAVRIEEMLNYFNYDYTAPNSTDTPFAIHTELAKSPWNEKTRLLHIGLKGYEVAAENRPSANLVFLLDVSGSMMSDNKLGLLKSSLNMLSNELTGNDRVSIVVYAGASGVVLEPTAGNNKRAIRRALNKLQAGGSTNGAAGIELAYDMAEQAMDDDSINRIILATDGDFNVGISDIDTLKELIERKRNSGIALTTLGFGAGNYNDHLMEQLADVGNGNYAYIDTLKEARKVLSEELTSTLLTIAKDVKIQIEFNPSQVSEYRLLGYVNRKLANEDFANDKVDAGEIGAGHTVTALYEVALVGEGGSWNSESRYQKPEITSRLNSELAEVRLRYKLPDETQSKLTSRQILRENIIAELGDTSDNFRFSAAVAGFGQLLRESKYLKAFNYDSVVSLAGGAKGGDRFGYRSEFMQLVDLANNLDDQNQAKRPVFKDQDSGDNEG